MDEDELPSHPEQDGTTSAERLFSKNSNSSEEELPQAPAEVFHHPFAVPSEPPPRPPSAPHESCRPLEPNAIMEWLDSEMKGRLSDIDAKLQTLSRQVGVCVDRLTVPKGPNSRWSTRKSTAQERRQTLDANPTTPKRTSHRQSLPVKDGTKDGAGPTESLPAELKGPRTTTRAENLDVLQTPSSNNRKIAERGTVLRFAGRQTMVGQDSRVSEAYSSRVTSHTSQSVSFQDIRTPSFLRSTFAGKNSVRSETGEFNQSMTETEPDDDDPEVARLGLSSASAWPQHKRAGITVQKHFEIAEKMNAFSQLPAAFRRDAVSLKERVWTFLDDTESSWWAMAYARFEKIFIILACFVSFLQTLDPPAIPGTTAAVLETCADVVFAVDCLLRFSVCPSTRGFFLNIYSWWDMLASSAIILRATQGFILEEKETAMRTTLLCVVPIIRLLKMLRHFQQFQLLLDAFSLAFEALPVLLFTLLIITLTASTTIFIVEPRDNIGNFPTAIWLTIVTMTTVGYGDITPANSWGSVVVAGLVIGSVLFMAMPLGIIGGAFTQVWNDRDRILLMKRTRERLIKWGYTPFDIPVLFEVADSDGTGEVDIDEFRSLMKNMKIGLANDRIVQLFNSFDNDCSGTIDAKEFIRNIFPGAYLDIFEKQHDYRDSTISWEDRASHMTGLNSMSASMEFDDAKDGDTNSGRPNSPPARVMGSSVARDTIKEAEGSTTASTDLRLSADGGRRGSEDRKHVIFRKSNASELSG